jgi:hypothetical protein
LPNAIKSPENIGRTINQIKRFFFAHNRLSSIKMLNKYKVVALPCLIYCAIIKVSCNYELSELKGLKLGPPKYAQLEKNT